MTKLYINIFECNRNNQIYLLLNLFVRFKSSRYIIQKDVPKGTSFYMAHPEGFEPSTF